MREEKPGKLSESIVIKDIWRAQAEVLFGTEGSRSLVEAINDYSKYSFEEFSMNAGVRMEAAAKTAPLEEAVIRGFIEILKKNDISKKGLMKDSPENIAIKYNKLFLCLHRNIFTDKKIVAGAFIDRLDKRIRSYLTALLAKDEHKYRRMNRSDSMENDKMHRKLERVQEIDQELRGGTSLRMEQKLRNEKRKLVSELKRSPFCTFTPGVNGRQDYFEVSTRRPFGDIIFSSGDDPEGLERRMEVEKGEALSVGEKYFLRAFGVAFNLAKNGWAKALNENKFRGIKKTSHREMKAANDRVFTLWKEEEKREIDMCTAIDHKLTGDRMVIHLSPIDEEQGVIREKFCIQVNYYGGKEAKEMEENLLKQWSQRARKVIGSGDEKEGAVSATSSLFPPLYLNRHTGEIESLSLPPEAIKVLAQDPRAYEAFRKDVLFFLAHLTCSKVTLEKMFGTNYSSPEGRPAGSRDDVPPEGGEESEDEKTSKRRRYPYGQYTDPDKRAEMVFKVLKGEEILYIAGDHELESVDSMTPSEVREAIENLEQSLTREAAVSHRRLLPLIKEEDEEGMPVVYGEFRPSAEAIELAKKHGRVLRRGIEFPELEEVFHPHDLESLFRRFEVRTLEEIVEMFPGRAFIRYETWVVPGRKEKDKKDEVGEETKKARRAVKAVIPTREPSES